MNPNCPFCRKEMDHIVHTKSYECSDVNCEFYANKKLMISPFDEIWVPPLKQTTKHNMEMSANSSGNEKCEICGQEKTPQFLIGEIEPVYVCTNINCGKEATKYDQGKLRYDLIPTDALKEVVKVFTYGAHKYEDRNWEKGMDWGRLYGAIQRHLNAFWSGIDLNEEDANLSHLAQAAWGCLCLEAYRLRKIEKDTREVTDNDE